jgi:hypothetical protein
MSLRRARVVAVYPDRGTVDVVDLQTAVPYAQVEVRGQSSSSGCSWRTPSVPKPSSNARGASIEPGMRNLIAYLDFVGAMPIVVGFSRPANGPMPMEQDRWLDVHDASGTYHTVAPDGSYEVSIPGGGCLRIGTGAHQDLTPLVTRGTLPNNGPPALTITLATANGVLSMDPTGHWTLTGAHVDIQCDVHCTGSLDVEGNVSARSAASGSFTTPTGQTVQVRDGIITNIF